MCWQTLQGKIPLFSLSHWLASSSKRHAFFVFVCVCVSEYRTHTCQAFHIKIISAYQLISFILWCRWRVNNRRQAPKVKGSQRLSFNFVLLPFTFLVKGRKWWSDDKYGACLERQKPFSCKNKPPCFSERWKTHFSAGWTRKRSLVFPFVPVNRVLLAFPEHRGRFIQSSKCLCSDGEIPWLDH